MIAAPASYLMPPPARPQDLSDTELVIEAERLSSRIAMGRTHARADAELVIELSIRLATLARGVSRG